MSAALETSALTVATLPLPAAWICCLASARVSGLRARIATSAPEEANFSAIARPRPLLPPVITAHFPSSLISIPGLLPEGLRPSSGGQSIDRLHFFVCQCPARGADILLDLFWPRGAGDDARHLRTSRQPADRELKERVAA